MTGEHETKTVGQIPQQSSQTTPFATLVLTRLVWVLFAASLAVLTALLVTDWRPALGGLFAIDGLTAVMWVTATFFSGIVHSYSRRYMAGEAHASRFFRHIFGFTFAVLVLVAANHVALFVAAWLAMGLLMAALIGHVRGWPQARAAGHLARRYFLLSSLSLAVGVALLWSATGATTVSGIITAAGTTSGPVVLVAVGALVLAALVQSALLPFHTWLLSSMTAPTPASALMHAGFVNAGGILLVRFAPVVVEYPAAMTAILILGATSALLGKLLKSVQPNVKRQLGCSTVGQMGFMFLQIGLGFFAAAITHLVLHGFYKAYLFLSAGGQVDHTAPTETTTRPVSGRDAVVVTVTAVAGGGLFALLTGKGTVLDSGLLLVLFVVLTTMHAARDVVSHSDLPVGVRYAAVPLVTVPAIGIYAVAYESIAAAMAGLPVVTAATVLAPIHWVVAATFLGAYIAIELDTIEHSTRLYVTLVNLGRPAPDTVLTATEDYNEH